MFELFTERARRVIILAQEEAKRLNHSAVGTEHLLLAIIREGEGVAVKVLESLNISPERVRTETEGVIGRGDRAPHEEVVFSPRTKRVFELAVDEVRLLDHKRIGTEHLLIGLIREGEGVAAQVLKTMGTLDRIRAQVVYLLGVGPKVTEISVLRSENATLRTDRDEWKRRTETATSALAHAVEALQAIAKDDELVQANTVFSIHAYRRCQESARVALAQIKEMNIDPYPYE